MKLPITSPEKISRVTCEDGWPKAFCWKGQSYKVTAKVNRFDSHIRGFVAVTIFWVETAEGLFLITNLPLKAKWFVLAFYPETDPDVPGLRKALEIIGAFSSDGGEVAATVIRKELEEAQK